MSEYPDAGVGKPAPPEVTAIADAQAEVLRDLLGYSDREAHRMVEPLRQAESVAELATVFRDLMTSVERF